MESKLGFTKMTIAEFEAWLDKLSVARTVLYIQQHHTWNPDYNSFKGTNHFELQKSMKDYHVAHHGWMDLGQHFTTFPDGSILTGRSLEATPACIYGFNAHSMCMEHLGNFDDGRDAMTEAHKTTIVRMTAALCKKFSVPATTNNIVYHHWFDLGTGERNNGTKNNKSCPGSNFFGGNKVPDCEAHFLPLVRTAIKGPSVPPISALLKYAFVTATTLNVRTQPQSQASIAADREPAQFGTIIRIYEAKSNWYRISSSKQHWVSAQYAKDALRAVVNADTLNVRNGAGASYSKVGSFTEGQELFIVEQRDGWCRIGLDDKWVSKDFLTY